MGGRGFSGGGPEHRGCRLNTGGSRICREANGGVRGRALGGFGLS